jgi:hypothetical protein
MTATLSSLGAERSGELIVSGESEVSAGGVVGAPAGAWAAGGLVGALEVWLVSSPQPIKIDKLVAKKRAKKEYQR